MQKPVTEKKKYFVVRERAVPEVLLKVVEAKKLLDSGKVDTVQDAAERTGISRSSFYKYKDDIFPFHEETRGKTITFIIQMDDEPGLLSVVLQTIARFHGNILTIHPVSYTHLDVYKRQFHVCLDSMYFPDSSHSEMEATSWIWKTLLFLITFFLLEVLVTFCFVPERTDGDGTISLQR